VRSASYSSFHTSDVPEEPPRFFALHVIASA
jgi:hypothetical protein